MEHTCNDQAGSSVQVQCIRHKVFFTDFQENLKEAWGEYSRTKCEQRLTTGLAHKNKNTIKITISKLQTELKLHQNFAAKSCRWSSGWCSLSLGDADAAATNDTDAADADADADAADAAAVSKKETRIMMEEQ